MGKGLWNCGWSIGLDAEEGRSAKGEDVLLASSKSELSTTHIEKQALTPS